MFDSSARQALKVRRLVASCAVVLLGACGQDNDEQAAPLDVSKDTVCVLDGMSLADYPGPKGQIRYADGKTDFFCDTVELVAMLLQPEQKRKVSIAYVNDMGKADWDAPHGNWIDAKSAFFVRGSHKRAAMGPTLVPFSEEGAAKAFVAKEGGEVMRFTDIKPEMVNMDGGVLHGDGSGH